MPSILCFPERRNLSEGDSVKFNIVLRGIMGGYPQIELTKGEAVFKLNELKWSGE